MFRQLQFDTEEFTEHFGVLTSWYWERQQKQPTEALLPAVVLFTQSHVEFVTLILVIVVFQNNELVQLQEYEYLFEPREILRQEQVVFEVSARHISFDPSTILADDTQQLHVFMFPFVMLQ